MLLKAVAQIPPCLIRYPARPEVTCLRQLTDARMLRVPSRLVLEPPVAFKAVECRAVELRAAALKGMPSRLSAAVASSAVLISRNAKRAFMRMDTIGFGGLQSPT